ncbi:hypothetical protein DL93DRAFT_771033 [Clavulina sp. PMI_390]|nr:hypothetical protein DL93DRAFT_771033 [Clavulina sp. PMI_390]
MKKPRFFSSKRVPSRIAQGSGGARPEKHQVIPSSTLTHSQAPSSTPLLSELPEDILISVLCHNLGLRDLIAIRKTCRRLHAISYLELPWIMLWGRLAPLGVLPPLKPAKYAVSPRSATGLTTGETFASPCTSDISDGDGFHNSTRCRMQNVFELQRRIHVHDYEEPLFAQETPLPSFSRPIKDFVAISMTPGGEILVVWSVSELLVCDLRHRTSLKLSITPEDDEPPPESSNFVTSMHKYQGITGILIVGTFIRASTISIFFQAMPSPDSIESSPVPKYLVLSEIPLSSSGQISSMELAQHYLIIELTGYSPPSPAVSSRDLKIFDIQLDRCVEVKALTLVRASRRHFQMSNRKQ